MAFTRNWDESSPLGSAEANTIDDIIRNGEVDISDRLKNMIYGFIAGENTLSQHFQYIQFYEQASVSQPSAGYFRIYCKAVGGKAELFVHDEDGDEKQITSGGALLLGAGDYVANSIDEDDIQLANDAYLEALDAAGTGTVDLIKAGTNDLPTLPDSSEMASNAAPTEDEGLVNKKYADDLKTGTADLIIASTAGAGNAYDTATTWTDLDLSAIVGSIKAMVYLRVVQVGGTVMDLKFRTKGHGVDVGPAVAASQYGGGVSALSFGDDHQGYIVVVTDSSGIIQHKAGLTGAGETFNVFVDAWLAVN